MIVFVLPNNIVQTSITFNKIMYNVNRVLHSILNCVRSQYDAYKTMWIHIKVDLHGDVHFLPVFALFATSSLLSPHFPLCIPVHHLPGTLLFPIQFDEELLVLSIHSVMPLQLAIFALQFGLRVPSCGYLSTQTLQS